MKTKMCIRFIVLVAVALGSYINVSGQCSNIQINVSPSGPYCEDVPVSMQATWNEGEAGCDVSTINWRNAANDALLATTSFDQPYSFSANPTITLYYAELIDSDGMNIGTSADENIIVNSNPVPSIMSNPPSPVCAETSVNLMVTSIFDNYIWEDGTSNQTNSEIPTAPSSTYSVTVEENGCLGTASFTINVNPLPEAIITDALPSTCIGNPINFSACNSTGSSLSYEWSPDDAALSNVNSCSPIWNPGSMFTQMYTVTVTDENGCKDEATLNATALSTPSPVIQVGSTRCVGTAIPLSNSGTSGNCTWSVNNGGVITQPSSCNNASLTVNSGGDYDVTLTVTVGTCSESVTETVSVNPTPTLNPTGGAACAGIPIELSCGVSGGMGPYSYTWSPANNLTNASSCTPSYIGDIPQSFNLTVTDANNCTATSIGIAQAQRLPTPTASINASSSTICEGGMVTLTANGGNSCEWSTGQETCTLTTGALTSDNTYSVTVTNNEGCTDDASITINVEPDPSVSINESQSVFCTDQTFTFTAIGVGGVGTYEYQWQLDGNIVQNWSSDPTISGSFNVEGDHVYSVRVRTPNGEGCDASSLVERNVSIITEPNPLIMGSIEICNNQQVLYYIDPADPNDSQIDWDVPGTPATVSIEEFGAYVFVQWGASLASPTYTLNVTDQIGIGDTQCMGMGDLVVSASGQTARPQADILYYPFNDLLIVKDSAATCYQWGSIDPNSSEIKEYEGETFQAFPVAGYDPDLIYWVKTWDGDCNNDACATYSFEVREAEEFFPTEEEKIFKVFPNPNNGSFQIHTNYLIEAEYELIVADVLGRIVYKKTVFPSLGEIDEPIAIDNAANGVYIVALLGANGKITRHQKIVVSPQ